MSQLRRLLGCVVLTAFPVAACSFITHFDDVVTTPPGGGGGGVGGGSAGGTNHGGNATGGTMASNAGAAGENAGGAPVGVPTQGVLAVAGTDPTKADANVVSLLDPTTGAEITRQTLTGAAVAGLAYDGAADKDVWFEFTAATFPAAPDSKADLQVYAFSDADSSWKTASTKVTALPPPRPESFVVLNDRLSYLSYDTATGADSLTVLDTTDPKTITQIKFTSPTFGGEVLGMVGTRGAPGGELTRARRTRRVALADCSGNALRVGTI